MRTDQQIVDETNELARLCLRHIGTGYEVAEGHLFYEADDPRSKTAWNMACEIQQMMTKTDPNDAITNLDADFEEIPRNFPVRLWMTARMVCETTVKATSMEDAVAKVKEIDFADYDFVFEMQDGDESAHIEDPDDKSADPIEVELWSEGEPLSWTAVHLTKDLAALFGQPWDRQTIDDFVSRAHRACTKISGGMES
ncbi:hypothetical protein ABE527_02480 [Brucella sp. TWI432]